ncbi:MAG: D-alanyl-D-alanine carboxypeptidase family protein [Pseudomonadota bacterium]|nr:D-alanyl-D-alanine carboxypeptidase family protein [Pseudomonadota bacterium]
MIRRNPTLMLLLFWPAVLLAAQRPIPAPPGFNASSYILLDANSGRVLAEKNPDERLEPASITKLMTTYVVYKALADGHIRIEDEVLVSEKAWRMEGSRMFIEVGKRVRVDDLIKGVVIQSGNDASVAIAEHVAGSESAFANMMNAEAEALGMSNTHFVNATGLPDPDHYMSARDTATLSAAIIREFPDDYALYSDKEFDFNGITQRNRNKLLWSDDSVDGLKTGYTKSAGYCLAASAVRDGMRLISVVMGADGARARATHSQALLSYGFRFYETHRIYEVGEQLALPRVWKGDKENVPVGTEETLYVTIPRGQYDNLKARMELGSRVMAPLGRGQEVGEAVVSLEGKEIDRQPLVALRPVPEGGLWRQTVDTVLLWLE